MKLALALAMVFAWGGSALAAPPDTLTDADLLAYAGKFFETNPPTRPDKTKDGVQSLGIYHGVEVVAAGAPCDTCNLSYVAIYFDLEDTAACSKIGGRRMLYLFRGESREARFTPFCVPDILVRNGLYGDGRPVTGR